MSSSTTTTNPTKAIFEVGAFWLVFALVLVGLGHLPRVLVPGWHEMALGGVLAMVSLGLIARLLRHQGQRLAHVGLAIDEGTLRRFGAGLLLGIVIVLMMIALLAGLTSIRVEPVASPDYADAVVFSFVVLLVLAYMEEVAFRSFTLVRLQKAWGIRAAIYLTAVAFALYHGPTQALNLLGPGVWGLLYGLAAVASRGIALPLGIHFGANWIQGLFGMKTEYASGLWRLAPGADNGLLEVNQAGVALQVVLLVVSMILIERYVRRRTNGGQPA